MSRPHRDGAPSPDTPLVPLRTLETVLGLTLAEARGRYARLTPRERQVADLMARGVPNPIIAEQLKISPKTLDIHRGNVLRKIEARTSVVAANVLNLLRLVEAATAG